MTENCARCPLALVLFAIMALQGCNQSQTPAPDRATGTTGGASQRQGAGPTNQPTTKPSLPEKPSNDVSFSEQRVQFNLSKGWKVTRQEHGKDHAICILERSDDTEGTMRIVIWAGEKFATEAIQIGLRLLPGLDKEKFASQLGAAGANRKMRALIDGADLDPGQITVGYQDLSNAPDMSWGLLGVESKADFATVTGVFHNAQAKDGGPLLVAWSCSDAGKDSTRAMVQQVFQMRKPRK
jgi:hypothetical protein